MHPAKKVTFWTFTNTHMAYGTKRFRSNRKRTSRRSFKSRSRPLRRATYKAVKRVAYRVLQRNTEMKYNDLSQVTIQQIDWNAQVLECMQNIVPGDNAESNRQGNKISCKALGVRINLFGNANSSRPMHSFRIIVLRWHNENGTAPGVSNLIAGTGANRYMAPYLWIPNKNFTIIDDTFIKVGGTATSTAPVGQPSQYMYNKFFKLKHQTTWDQTSNLIQDGGVYVFILSDEDPSYGFRPYAKWETRLYYKDD